MGLDMYAFSRPGKLPRSTDFDPIKSDKEIAYWRKHPNLHGWMERLYREKNGGAESFNCVTLEVTEEDLNRLESDVLGTNLPETTGFFFGASSPDDQLNDIAFIQKARSAIARGESVYYTSWW